MTTIECDPGTKVCSACRLVKSLTEFYTERCRKDGLSYVCKSCASLKAKRYYATDQGRKTLAAYRRSDKGRQVRRLCVEKYYEENPLARVAHKALNHAVEAGRIVKPTSCEACQKSDAAHIHGHHEDYNKPLDVRWVCPACHRKIHLPTPGTKGGGK